ncbi:putative ribonuclease H-like domain-containing protein [Tanacetum coccineum]
MGRVTGQKELRPVWNNAQRVNYQNKLNHPHPKRNFVPTAVAIMSGLVQVNAAKQSSPKAAASITTARYVNTASLKQKVNVASPIKYSYFKAHSPLRRPFNQISAAKTNNLKKIVYTAKDQGIFDSGCSRHMTRNKSYLTDYQKIDGGFVVFAGSPKGGGLTCLIAKATIDESNLWPRRLGHINFKSMNKLVRGNLVRGLPSKLFENDHSCVACQKGKQQKASCKTKLVSSIIHPLQILHMDLFGPTFVRSINHKIYFLVVTDDYSRCDNGTEFKNNDMNQFCGVKGTKRKFRVARTPQQNRVAKIKNMTLIENSVLVTKPHNKTPYKLLLGRPPSISFIRPCRYLVTILNTLDPLGKFDGKADEGFLVGYSINSKDFRVFNTRTRKVEENLHINFLENKPNVAGSGPEWLFDIDLLTNSMNDEPYTTYNQTNRNASIKDNVDAVPTQHIFCYHYFMIVHRAQRMQLLMMLVKRLMKNQQMRVKEMVKRKKEELQIKKMTRIVSTVSPPVSANGQSFDNANDLPTDPLMPDLEKDVGAEADLNNLETIMNVSSIPTTRIHNDHPKDQIIEDINSATQTRRMTKIYEEHALVSDSSLDSPSRIEAMQEELLQFKLQKVWTLVDLPNGKRAIGTKWVFRNKKDKRGIVVRNKARPVAQDEKNKLKLPTPLSEVEVVAAAIAMDMCYGFKNQMLDYGFNFMNTKIHIDNESTICIMKNPVFHAKPKHIEIRHHFLRDSYEKRLIQVIKIHTDHNVADLLTKAFDVKQF